MPKKLFTYYAEGFNLKGERSLCYGLNVSNSREFTIGFATLSFLKRYGANPYRVETTEQSVEEVLKQIGLSFVRLFVSEN